MKYLRSLLIVTVLSFFLLPGCSTSERESVDNSLKRDSTSYSSEGTGILQITFESSGNKNLNSVTMDGTYDLWLAVRYHKSGEKIDQQDTFNSFKC
ncbi:MAG: hypothetical protein ABFR75_14720 [Acidobacteriota bacterium]